jgi:hypothetical protein
MSSNPNNIVNHPKYQVPVVEIKVQVMPNNQVLVHRPDGDEPEQLAAIMEVLATAITIICRKLAQHKSDSRIVLPAPGTKVN